jgi:hypothetical protein
VTSEIHHALRLLAGLIAADLRAGSPALTSAQTNPSPDIAPRKRGRPKSIPYAVSATPLACAA